MKPSDIRRESVGERSERDRAARIGEIRSLVAEHLRWHEWKQKDLASVLGWTEQNLSRKLGGFVKLSYDEMNRIAEVLRIEGTRYTRWRQLTGYELPVVLEFNSNEVEAQQREEMLRLLRETHEQVAPSGPQRPRLGDQLFVFERVELEEHLRSPGRTHGHVVRGTVDFSEDAGNNHGRNRQQLAEGFGRTLGVPPDQLRWDYWHDCGSADCPERRLYDEVFTDSGER